MRILLDENNYFTGNYAVIGDIPNSIEVNELPNDLSNNKTKAWQWCHITESTNSSDGAMIYKTDSGGNLLKDEEGNLIPKTDKDGNILYSCKPYDSWVFDDTRYKELLLEIQEREANRIKTNEELTQEVNDLSDMLLASMVE